MILNGAAALVKKIARRFLGELFIFHYSKFVLSISEIIISNSFLSCFLPSNMIFIASSYACVIFCIFLNYDNSARLKIKFSSAIFEPSRANALD